MFLITCWCVYITQLGSPGTIRFVIFIMNRSMWHLADSVFFKILLRHFQIVHSLKAAVANRRIAVHRVRAVYYIVIIVESFLNSRYLCCPPAILSFFHRIAFHSPQIQLHIMRTVCPQIKSGSSSLPICHLCARMFFPVSATRSAFLIKCMNQTFVDRIRH